MHLTGLTVTGRQHFFWGEMMKKTDSLAILIALTLTQIGFAGSHEQNTQQNAGQGVHSVSSGVSADTSETSEANNAFAFQLYDQIRHDNPQDNQLFSPVSAFLALAMVYNGADAKTKTQIAQTLNVDGLTVDQLNHGAASIIRRLQKNDPDFTLQIANAIYADQKFKLDPNFLKRVGKAYLAQIKTKDFGLKKTVTDINDWVKKNTNNKIDSIIDSLNKSDKMVLLNATYFNSKWDSPFKTNEVPTPFHQPDGSVDKVKSMHKTEAYRFLSQDGYQAVELPYGQQGRASMVVVVPNKGTPLRAWEQGMNGTRWDNLDQALSAKTPERASVTMPKFSYTEKTDLTAPLSDAMPLAFTDYANFSKLGTPALKIGQALQKTYIDVNEKGTEAAAVTGLVMRSLAMGLPERIPSIEIDRPFFYAIKDNQTGAILFMGSVSKPKPKQ